MMIRCDGCGRKTKEDDLSSCCSSNVDLSEFGVSENEHYSDVWFCNACLSKLGFCRKCQKSLPKDVMSRISKHLDNGKGSKFFAGEDSLDDNAKKFRDWITTFIEEKEVDMSRYILIGDVVSAMLTASPTEQKAIKETFVKIDFANGDVYDFINHLAQALNETHKIGM